MRKWLARTGLVLWYALDLFLINPPIWLLTYQLIGAFWLALAVFVSFFLWGLVFYLLLSLEEGVKKAQELLLNLEKRRWLRWLTGMRERPIFVYLVFLVLGVPAGVAFLKIGQNGRLRDVFPKFLLGCIISSAVYSLSLLIGWEFLIRIFEAIRGWLSIR